MPDERVRVITPLVGGGFGGKSAGPQAVEAARLAKLAGAPVQVVWTRDEEFFLDTFRPAAYVTITSGLNAAGKIVSWDYHVRFAGERSSEMIYDAPHVRTLSTGSFGGGGPHPFGTGAWRGPGSNTNIFARESHIDTMAAKAGIDPVEFRLRNLANPRLVRTLKAAADRFGWTPGAGPEPPRPRRGPAGLPEHLRGGDGRDRGRRGDGGDPRASASPWPRTSGRR